MDSHSLVGFAILFLAAAVTVVPVFKRLGLGSVLGYLVAGALLGPSGLALVSDPKSLMAFAELGVVMLLFLIGLELRPSRLWVMRRAVLGLGAAQVGITALAVAAFLKEIGWDWSPSLVAGAGLSFSSTPFALQLLAERNEMNTTHGRASFAILLFQDLAVIPLLALVPLLSDGAGSAPPGLSSLPRGAAVLASLALAGRFLVPRIFRLAASTRMREVFVAAALLVVLGTASLVEITGLSSALGAFLAGVLLSGSEYRHELEAAIEPFEGLLLGLFFMAVGMAVELSLLFSEPGIVLSGAAGLMALKFAVLYGIGRAARFSDEGAKGMASALPQGGEFAFVLFGAATGYRILPDGAGQLLAVVVTLSMALTPLLLFVNDRFLCGRAGPAGPFDDVPAPDAPVLIAGFGRFGQIVGRVLRMKGIPFTALEHDPDAIEVIRRFGNEVYYGDASREDLLAAAGAARARLFVLAIDEPEASVRTARTVQKHYPGLPIVARARNRQHAYELMKIGLTPVFRETFASSLEMAERALVALGDAPEQARRAVARFREHDERMLLEQLKYYGNEKELVDFSRRAAQQLTELMKSDATTSPPAAS